MKIILIRRATIFLTLMLALVSWALLTYAAPSGYRMPFLDRTVITNGPGEGMHIPPFSSEAIDYDPISTLQARAANSGTVCYSDVDNTGFGELILIRHDDGSVSFYAHLAPNSRRFEEHDPVSRGAIIGTIGNTGCGGCGVHLHFEARSNVTINK